MITVTTSNSVYEIDEEHRRARKQGAPWRSYEAHEFIAGRVVIVFDERDTVITSKIVSVDRGNGQVYYAR
jgi:hypothetical protein